MAQAADTTQQRHAAAGRHFEEAREIYHSDQFECRGFEILQLLSIGYYQRDLCLLARNIMIQGGIKAADDAKEADEIKKMRDLLTGYVEALRDLESTLQREPIWPKGVFPIRDNAISATNADPPQKYTPESYLYNLTGSPQLDTIRKVLQKMAPKSFGKRAHHNYNQPIRKKKNRFCFLGTENGDVEDHPVVLDDSHARFSEPPSATIDGLARTISAIFGGTSLLVPMILMTHFTSPNARLIIVAVAVIIFGLLTSLFTKATNQEILGASAAYTAVMVV
ncbi:hypothetical protein MMC30_008527, partial [Trapelia coarctata]|nr:hypothetical protein [Trapelia coarctata]